VNESALPGEWTVPFLRSVLDAAPEGIVICAARGTEQPLVYANAAFERLTGYTASELLGADLRILQGSDREQEGRASVRQAIERGASARILLRNYRKDGAQFWNEMLIEPVRDASGTVTHFVGFHRDVGERERAVNERERANGVRAVGGLPTWMREDRLTGLCARAYFEELLRHDWLSAQRETRTLTLLMFDFDALGAYNDTFGRPAGDACLRRLAGVISAAFRRGSDLVGRWEGGTLCALARNTDQAAVVGFAEGIVQRVLDQRIRHPRLLPDKYVTISVGIAMINPGPKQQPELLLQAATRALARARTNGAGPVVQAGDKDFGR
jgi:diguanylate cyclase (GGDEF)-like protein/PAS domain S-box-containing protein